MITFLDLFLSTIAYVAALRSVLAAGAHVRQKVLVAPSRHPELSVEAMSLPV